MILKDPGSLVVISFTSLLRVTSWPFNVMPVVMMSPVEKMVNPPVTMRPPSYTVIPLETENPALVNVASADVMPGPLTVIPPVTINPPLETVPPPAFTVKLLCGTVMPTKD